MRRQRLLITLAVIIMLVVSMTGPIAAHETEEEEDNEHSHSDDSPTGESGLASVFTLVIGGIAIMGVIGIFLWRRLH